MFDSVFGHRMVEKLNSRKMTQHELAEKIGRSESSVSRYCCTWNPTIPSEEVLQKIAYVLDTTPEYLLGSGEDFSPSQKYAVTMIKDWGSGWTYKQKRELVELLLNDVPRHRRFPFLQMMDIVAHEDWPGKESDF